MKIATLLLKVLVASVCHYASMGSSSCLCGLLLKSLMGQLRVGSAKHAQVTNVVCLYIVNLCPCTVHELHTIQYLQLGEL